jgi:PKD repeat protein
VHTYASPGTYVACHTITGGSSAGGAFSCTFCDTIVIGSIPCNASYTFTQSGSVVNFTSTSSGPGTIFSHSWNFGDGSPVSNAVNPSHIYATAGVYSACHTIIGTSPTGTFTCTYCDSILISGPTPCNASFVFSQSANIVSFASTSSGPGPITSHSWNFGDGSPLSPSANPVHTYPAPGTYIVCHTISGGGTGTMPYSCTTCDTLTIGGGGMGSCNITANFSNSTGSLNVSFSNMTTCTGCTSMTYKWSFGDLSPISTATNPSHLYSAAGTYTVCLVSTGLDSNSSPCIDTTCKAITVVGSSGINDIEGQSINFHPNPSSGLFTYSLMPGEIMSSMEIMDLTGRRVLNYSTRNNGKDVMLDLSYVPNGMYYVHLRLQNGRSLMAKVQVRH